MIDARACERCRMCAPGALAGSYVTDELKEAVDQSSLKRALKAAKDKFEWTRKQLRQDREDLEEEQKKTAQATGGQEGRACTGNRGQGGRA